MNGSEFSDVLSEYTHYTQKTHGKTLNPTFLPVAKLGSFAEKYACQSDN